MVSAKEAFMDQHAPQFDADPRCSYREQRGWHYRKRKGRSATAEPSCFQEMCFDLYQTNWTPAEQLLAASDPMFRGMIGLASRIAIVPEDNTFSWGRGGDVSFRIVIRTPAKAPVRYALTGLLHACERLGQPVRVQVGVDRNPLIIDKLEEGSNSFGVIVGDSAWLCDEKDPRGDFLGAGDPGRYDEELSTTLSRRFRTSAFVGSKA